MNHVYGAMSRDCASLISTCIKEKKFATATLELMDSTGWKLDRCKFFINKYRFIGKEKGYDIASRTFEIENYVFEFIDENEFSI